MPKTNVCALPGCRNSIYKRRRNDSLSWHKFPYRDAQLLEQWIKACIRLDDNLPYTWHPTSNSLLCPAHFKPTDFLNRELRGSRVCLHPSSIPSIMSTNSNVNETQVKSSKAPLKKTLNTPLVVKAGVSPGPLSKKLKLTPKKSSEDVSNSKGIQQQRKSQGPYTNYQISEPEASNNYRQESLHFTQSDNESSVVFGEDSENPTEQYEMDWSANQFCEIGGECEDTKDTEWETQRLTGMCRVCAESRSKLIFVYGEMGISNKISEKIHMFLPILVTPDDLLPVTICQRCLSYLEQSQKLVDTCLEADKKLRELLEAKLKSADGTAADSDYGDYDSGQVGGDNYSEEEEEEVKPVIEFSPPQSPVSGTERERDQNAEPTPSGSNISAVNTPASAKPKRRKRIDRAAEGRNELLALTLTPTPTPNGSKVPNILRRRSTRTRTRSQAEAEAESQGNLSPTLQAKMRSYGIKEASVVMTKVDIPQHNQSTVVTTVSVPMSKGPPPQTGPAQGRPISSGSRRLYRCLYCSETGSDAYKLLVHQLSMHPGNLLKCPHCAFLCGSDQKQKMDAHVMTHSADKTCNFVIQSVESLSDPQSGGSTTSPATADSGDGSKDDLDPPPDGTATAGDVPTEPTTSASEVSGTPTADKNVVDGALIPSIMINQFPSGPISVIVSPLNPEQIAVKGDSIQQGDKGPRDLDQGSETVASGDPDVEMPPPKEHVDTNARKSLLVTEQTPKIAIPVPMAQSLKTASTYMLRIHVDSLLPPKAVDRGQAQGSILKTNGGVAKEPQRAPLIPITLYQCAKCRMNYDSKESVEKHVCFPSNLIPIAPKPGAVNYACTTCGQVFSDSAELREHSLTHSASFKCDSCDSAFRSEFLLKSHKRKHEVKKESHQCPHCPKAYSLRSRLRVHLYSHSSEPRCVCPQCGKVFRTDGGFRAHIRAHENKRPYACSVCGQRFNRRGNMRRHEGACDKNKSLTCKYCNLTFDRHDDLLVHRATNHAEEELAASIPLPIPDVSAKSKEKRYSCKVCSEAFVRVVDMRRHQVNSHSEEELNKVKDVPDGGAYLCHTCGKQLYHKHNYRMHLLHHMGKGIFKCQECPSTFTSKFALNYHAMLHTGEFPHKCSICNEGFRSTIALQVHRFKHTGEKPFRCRMCDMTFFSSHSLRLHLVVHSTERNYSCRVCGSTFKRKKTLHYHSLIHTGEKPYKCKICGRAFRQKGTCNIHERNHSLPRKVKDGMRKNQQRLQERLKNLQWRQPSSSEVKEAIFVVRETDELKSGEGEPHENEVEAEIIDSGLLSMYPDLEVKDHAEIVDENVKTSLSFSTAEQTISIIQ